MDTNAFAKEFEGLLKQFNKGIKAVEMPYGILVVTVSSLKSARGVCFDLAMSKAFQSIRTCQHWNKKSYVIEALPK